MNYFVEGLQGSGKSTLVGNLSKKHPDLKVYHEGDYSPIELAWCAYLSREQYSRILEKYAQIKDLIEAKSYAEGDRMVVCYTQILTDIPGFHKDLEQYEIYKGRVPFDEFKRIVLDRYRKWNGDSSVFECSLFQNIVEDMILFRCLSDNEIIDFYCEVSEALKDKEYRIEYLKTSDIPASIGVIRKERSDEAGKELWFPLMIGYFNDSPYAVKNGLAGEEALFAHFKHRQDLELQICEKVFKNCHVVLQSKDYKKEDI